LTFFNDISRLNPNALKEDVLKIPTEASNIGAKIVTVHHDNAVKNADGSYNISLKDFYAEESRDVIWRNSISDICNNDLVPQVAASIQYLDTLRSKLEQSEEILGSIRRPEGDELSEIDQHVFLQCIRIQTTDIIEESQKLADQGRMDEAKVKITSHIEFLQKQTTLRESALFKQLLSELNTIKSGLTSFRTYQQSGSFAMQSHWFAHKNQRCSASSEQTLTTYRSSKKRFLANKMKMMSKTTKM
jgi:hypothetical protein